MVGQELVVMIAVDPLDDSASGASLLGTYPEPPWNRFISGLRLLFCLSKPVHEWVTAPYLEFQLVRQMLEWRSMLKVHMLVSD